MNQIARFFIGLVWAALSGLTSAGADILDDLYHYADPLDWGHIGRIALAGAIFGVIGFLKSEKARFDALMTPVPEVQK